jgi:hypothetical protein
MNVHWRKSTNRRGEKLEKKFAAFNKVFRLRKRFQGRKQEKNIYFSFRQGKLKI